MCKKGFILYSLLPASTVPCLGWWQIMKPSNSVTSVLIEIWIRGLPKTKW